MAKLTVMRAATRRDAARERIYITGSEGYINVFQRACGLGGRSAHLHTVQN